MEDPFLDSPQIPDPRILRAVGSPSDDFWRWGLLGSGGRFSHGRGLLSPSRPFSPPFRSHPPEVPSFHFHSSPCTAQHFTYHCLWPGVGILPTNAAYSCIIANVQCCVLLVFLLKTFTAECRKLACQNASMEGIHLVFLLSLCEFHFQHAILWGHSTWKTWKMLWNSWGEVSIDYTDICIGFELQPVVLCRNNRNLAHLNVTETACIQQANLCNIFLAEWPAVSRCVKGKEMLISFRDIHTLWPRLEKDLLRRRLAAREFSHVFHYGRDEGGDKLHIK